MYVGLQSVMGLQSPMVTPGSDGLRAVTKPDGVIRHNPMVLNRLVEQILFTLFINHHNKIVIVRAKVNSMENKEKKMLTI